jgi:uncharacterized membrane protein
MMSFFHGFGADLLAFLSSVLLVGVYYLFLKLKSRKDPTYTIHGINELARSLWVINVMNNPNKDVMAVQTLRNFVMGASLMASTASLLIIGTLTLSGQTENISRSWHVLNLMGTHAAEIWIIKVICLLIDFIIAFFAFAMAVRIANQVVFMLNVPHPEAHKSLSPYAVGQRLNRAGGFFAIGMRAFFFAVPLVFWLFGPAFLVIAAAWLVYALYRLDRGELGTSTAE